MREILFRGKTVNRKENKWIYGSLVSGIRKYDNEPTFFIYDLDTEMDSRGWIDNYFGEEVDPETVGQWTGLVDKNCVEIFEGDVIESPVKRLGYKHGNLIIITDIRECKFIALYANSYKIIGNVWDNPELIEIGGINER